MSKAKKKSNAEIIKFPERALTTSLMQSLELNGKLSGLLSDMAQTIASMLLCAIKQKDAYTYGHSLRVARYSLMIGKQIGLNEQELHDLEIASVFHDIGKIGIPDLVLNKPARLEEDEFKVMQKHPENSYELLSIFEEFKQAAYYAKHHHERFDGRGYPSKMKGEEIPYPSRIILVADTFDSMTSTRPYRQGLPFEVAFSELNEFINVQFDPFVVKQFMAAMEKDAQEGDQTFELSLVKGKFNKIAA